MRPDGRISVPLLEDVQAADKTPTELAREIEQELSAFVADPLVTVIVTDFVGPSTQQVRVVGEATEPQAIPYRGDMTLLDVMIAAGGLTDFAAGNRATLVRTADGAEQEYRVRLDDLLRDGDISANVAMRPGDVVIIPETFFWRTDPQGERHDASVSPGSLLQIARSGWGAEARHHPGRTRPAPPGGASPPGLGALADEPA